MKNLQKIIVLITFAFFINCSEDNTVESIEFGEITGRVVKASNTDEPIENAKITLSPTNNTTFTDANGDFIFEETPVNEYSIEASKEDFIASYKAASIVAGASVNVVLEMEIETALNKPPTTPVLISPIDGTLNTENSIELVWSSSDVDEDALTYRLEIKNDFNNKVINIENLSDTTYVVSNLKFGGKYFWQVAASDDINTEVLSTSNSFTVTEDPGNRFTYVKIINGNNVIYSATYNPDTSEVSNTVQLTESNTNSWRPRKNNTVNRIAFLKTYNNETHIFTMKPDGSDVTKITGNIPVNTFNLNEVDFSWSASGDKFIYPSFDKLYMINNDGSGLVLIHKTANGNLITECDWSSDGKKIALRTNDSEGYNGDIYTINMNGVLLESVISANIGALGGLNFSIDGKNLLYTKDISNFQSSNFRRLDNRVFKYSFITLTETEIASSKPAGTNDLDPRFSPNEAKIIFVNTSNDGISENKIFISASSGGTREEVFQGAIMPDWE